MYVSNQGVQIVSSPVNLYFKKIYFDILLFPTLRLLFIESGKGGEASPWGMVGLLV